MVASMMFLLLALPCNVLFLFMEGVQLHGICVSGGCLSQTCDILYNWGDESPVLTTGGMPP